ncbi:MAG: folate family ECF transporter S component [Erysipelotrichaceae bacterium]|nr:folate family ECF transporter S component [Erysipelotrichaceae bacterium]
MNMLKPIYWKKACDQVKDLRILCLCSIFVSLQIITASAFIPVSENLRIYFSFFFTALFSCIGGPVMALICGFAADIINFILFPSGAFFFGYTLSAMLGAFIFALFLWDTKITILKLALSRIIITLFVNILLGSVWTSMLYSKGFIYYVIKSAVKNLALLPIEIILIVLMFKVILPFLYRKHLTKSSKLTLL